MFFDHCRRDIQNLRDVLRGFAVRNPFQNLALAGRQMASPPDNRKLNELQIQYLRGAIDRGAMFSPQILHNCIVKTGIRNQSNRALGTAGIGRKTDGDAAGHPNSKVLLEHRELFGRQAFHALFTACMGGAWMNRRIQILHNIDYANNLNRRLRPAAWPQAVPFETNGRSLVHPARFERATFAFGAQLLYC